MSHPMDGCWAKIERANEHIKYLTEELQRFLEDNAGRYRIVAQLHDKRDDRLFVVKAFDDGIAPVPLRLCVIVGEVLHQLRSSLDHLIWALARRKHANPGFKIGFPVCETRDKYEKSIKNGIVKGISGKTLPLIEAVQPYRESAPRKSPLFILDDLNITDKHKLLMVAVFAVRPPDAINIDPGEADITFVLPDPKLIRPYVRPTKDGAEVFRYRIRGGNPKTKVHLNFPCHIALHETGTTQFQAVIPSLVQLRDATVRILELFKGEF